MFWIRTSRGMTASAVTRLPRGAHDVDLGGFFVGGEVGLEVEALDLLAVVVIEDPGTGGEGGTAHHVLSAGVACLVVEPEKGEFV